MRCPAAEEVVAKHPKGVNHCKQFEDARQVGLLGRCELAALVGHRMVVSLVVRLRENGRDRHLAGVGREHGAPGRVEGAEDGCRGQAVLQCVKALLLSRPPVPGGVRPAQPGERGSDTRVSLDEAAVVIAQPDKLA